jgi:hypothetical protein
MNEDANDIRKFEPIFGGARFPVGYFYPRDEIERTFGRGGGFLIDYACGVVSFKQYLMKCEVCGKSDYNIGLLVEIYEYYRNYAEKYNTFMERETYFVHPDEIVTLKKFKSRLVQLKYEISQMNLKGIDNL